jgi:hypothetical protein
VRRWSHDPTRTRRLSELGASGTLRRTRCDWSPDDPRLYAAADRAQRWLANWHDSSDGAAKPALNPAIAQLVTTTPVGVSSPAWDRLIEIAKQVTGG